MRKHKKQDIKRILGLCEQRGSKAPTNSNRCSERVAPSPRCHPSSAQTKSPRLDPALHPSPGERQLGTPRGGWTLLPAGESLPWAPAFALLHGQG